MKFDRDNPQIPEPHEVIAYERTFDAPQAEKIRRGFQARQMEDKWCLKFMGSHVFCMRSWTGYCLFAIECEATAGGELAFRRVLASRDPTWYKWTSAAEDLETVNFLVDQLLLGSDRAAPGLEEDPMGTWSKFGRAAFPESDDLKPGQ